MTIRWRVPDLGCSHWFFQVIKPSVVGGFGNTAIIAQWAQQHQKMAVVSAAFESGLGLSAYSVFLLSQPEEFRNL